MKNEWITLLAQMCSSYSTGCFCKYKPRTIYSMAKNFEIIKLYNSCHGQQLKKRVRTIINMLFQLMKIAGFILQFFCHFKLFKRSVRSIIWISASKSLLIKVLIQYLLSRDSIIEKIA